MAWIRTRLVAVFSLGALLAGAVSGCASYANAPGPRSTPAVEDPNRRNPAAVVAEALRTIQTRHPVPGEYAVQFPSGTTQETASKALARMGDGARRAGPQTAGLPTYYIGRVWIRTGLAKVDVLRPVVELEPAAGGHQHRPYTVWMEGGLNPWYTTRVQRWAIGSMPLPTEGGDVPRRTAGSNAIRAGYADGSGPASDSGNAVGNGRAAEQQNPEAYTSVDVETGSSDVTISP